MKVPVYIITTSSKCIGEVDVESKKEFFDAAEELWKSQGYDAPTINISNDFDLGDWDIDETDLDYYFKEKNSVPQQI